MADTTKVTSVDEYLASFDGHVRERLEAVRQVFAETLPDAEEVISYNIPAFRQDGMFVVYFSGHKAHISIACYPTERLYESLHRELHPRTKTKSGPSGSLTSSHFRSSCPRGPPSSRRTKPASQAGTAR